MIIIDIVLNKFSNYNSLSTLNIIHLKRCGETDLVRVQNDQRSDVMLVLLDPSAAFDTVDYHILLKRLI